MKTNLRVKTDTYTLRMSAFCGMSYNLHEGLELTKARQLASRYLRAKRRDGYAVSKIGRPETSGSHDYDELTEPETAVMVPDDAGILSIKQDTVPGWECWNCGDVLPCGTGCTCQDAPDGDDA